MAHWSRMSKRTARTWCCLWHTRKVSYSQRRHSPAKVNTRLILGGGPCTQADTRPPEDIKRDWKELCAHVTDQMVIRPKNDNAMKRSRKSRERSYVPESNLKGFLRNIEQETNTRFAPETIPYLQEVDFHALSHWKWSHVQGSSCSACENRRSISATKGARTSVFIQAIFCGSFLSFLLSERKNNTDSPREERRSRLEMYGLRFVPSRSSSNSRHRFLCWKTSHKVSGIRTLIKFPIRISLKTRRPQITKQKKMRYHHI